MGFAAAVGFHFIEDSSSLILILVVLILILLVLILILILLVLIFATNCFLVGIECSTPSLLLGTINQSGPLQHTASFVSTLGRQ